MRASTEWLKDARWGVFTHYLTDANITVEDWNSRVDGFDVAGLVQQLISMGAPYYFITIGQNSGHYCSPNATYDSFVGTRSSKCSRRDLIKDLYDALVPNGIKLMVYLPSGAPAADPVAMQKLGWKWGFKGDWPSWSNEPTGERLAEFQVKWEAVMREWSLRWGKNVSGWWIDGCYFADAMYRHPDPPNFESFAAALKAGNPDSIVAFNPGVLTPVISMTEHEDYTAGEISEVFPESPGRWVDGAQYHILSYLGSRWGSGEPRFTNEYAIEYTKDVNSKGGVVTWDVPISVGGLIPQSFVDQLTVLGEQINP